MLRCNEIPSESIEDLLRRAEEESAHWARLDEVLLPGDEVVGGINALARLTPWSRQRFAYGLAHYEELRFIWRDRGPAPISM